MVRLMSYVQADYDEENGMITISTPGQEEYEFPEVTVAVEQYLEIAEKIKHKLSEKQIAEIGKGVKK